MTKLLFIGDSITEHGRFNDVDEIGFGYVGLINDFIQTTYPDKQIKVVNRGIIGDEITHFEKRWTKDVIQNQPDILSISVGINDVWGVIEKDTVDKQHLAMFSSTYRKLLDQVKQKTQAKIIVMEPTIITKEKHIKGNEFLKEYVEVVKKLSEEYACILVPTHHIFESFQDYHPHIQLTSDGIHMTRYGTMLLAKTWWKHVNEHLFQ